MRVHVIYAILILLAASAAGFRGASKNGGQRPPVQIETIAGCQQVMASEQRELNFRVHVMDQKLDQLLAGMNLARDNRKMEATSEVVNEIVSQIRDLHESTMRMQDLISSHIIEQVQNGSATCRAFAP